MISRIELPHRDFAARSPELLVCILIGFFSLRRGRELHPRIEVLQTSALLLGYHAVITVLIINEQVWQTGRQHYAGSCLRLPRIDNNSKIFSPYQDQKQKPPFR